MNSSPPYEEIHNNPERAELSAKIKETLAANYTLEDLPSIKTAFEGDSEDEKIIAAIKLRKLSIIDDSDFIQSVIDSEMASTLYTEMIES